MSIDVHLHTPELNTVVCSCQEQRTASIKHQNGYLSYLFVMAAPLLILMNGKYVP